MLTSNSTWFPSGFLLASKAVSAPDTFIAGPIIPNFYVHPSLSLNYAGNKNRFVIILGDCIPTKDAQLSDAAENLLGCLRVGDNVFLEELGSYGGRHAVIFGSNTDICVVNDATAMRSVFYSTDDSGVISSHAKLVESTLGGAIKRDDLVYGYGYPGNHTPYSRTRVLTANTYLSLSKGTIHRFWPTDAPRERSVDEVAAEILESASLAMRHYAQNRPVRIALTAGVDSRAVLAVGLHSRVTFDTYTYGTTKNTALDRAFAADFAKYLGVTHNLVTHVATPTELKKHLAEAHYSPHHQGEVMGLIDFFTDQRSLAVSGNLLEIGRSFYKNYSGQEPPVTAEAMASLHLRSMPRSVQEKIHEYGKERYLTVAVAAFQSFIDETEYTNVEGLLDPFDQFYWEHRMSTWHGPAMVERDFYATAFIPFNSRRIFEAMLGVSLDERKRAAVFYRLIEMVEPRMLDYPVNPKKWPPEV